MLLPLSLKTSKSVALSIIKINQFYSIKANEKYFHIDKSYRFTSEKYY